MAESNERDRVLNSLKRRQDEREESFNRFYDQLQAKWGEKFGEYTAEFIKELRSYHELIIINAYDTQENQLREKLVPWVFLDNNDTIPTEMLPPIPIEQFNINKETVIRLMQLLLTDKEIAETIESRIRKYL